MVATSNPVPPDACKHTTPKPEGKGATVHASSLVHSHTTRTQAGNKEHYAHLLLGQTAAAVIASSVVSPAMTVIDLSM